MITSIAFTVYPVSNMERARAFYEHVLGLHVSHNYQGQWVEYQVGGATFAITTSDMGQSPGAKGAVVAFEVSDLEAFIHKMKERAVTFVTEAFDTPVCRMAIIEDQDGNRVTIHKRHA
ncbi:MAG TPA: VOC family protein [Nitrospiraceae bacterium]|jgi:predicted enzyme related to lactoylglutathione lyase|nr:VOC family protein [Nitrospiraceae bacterium]